MSVPLRRSSVGCHHFNLLPNTSSPRPAIPEVPAPLSPTPPLPLDRPLPQLFTRTALPSQSRRQTEQPPPLGPYFPTPNCAPNSVMSQSRTGRTSRGRAASNQHLECSQAGNRCPPSNPADMERSKRGEGLREIQPVCRGATYPLTSNSYYPSKLFSNTRSMTSIYQLVSTRVKGHAPAIQKRDNLNGSTSSRSIRYSPSLTGSDTIGGRNHGGQSTTSVPSLSNSVSSQSTVFSSLSVGHPTFSDDFCPLSPTSSSISSKPSLRSTSGSAINKSFQSLIRRRKQKFTDLNGSQPRSSLNIDTNLCTDIKPHKPMPKSAAASRIHFVGNAESGSSTMLFGSFPVNPLQSNDCHSSILECGHDNFKPPQTTIFSGSIVSKDLPLAGTHPRQPAPKVIVRKNTNSLSDDSEMEDMLANLRNIAATRKPMVPAAEKQPVSPELEGEDEDDSETEDMMANLRGIAASRKPAGLTAEEQFTSLLSARSGSALLEDDQSSIACSESDSESSFEADVVADELPDHFPLPSWPKLDSTSQSPFTQQSLTSSAYSPADCSVSFSREHLC